MGILGEVGYSRLTVEEVAARAGVSKTSLYLRWAGKEALVADALGYGAAILPEPADSGRLAEDLRSFLLAVVTSHEAGFAKAASAVSGEILTNPKLREAFRQSLVAAVSERVAVIVRRGVARGELAEDTDIELLAVLPMAILQHLRLAGEPRPDSAVVVERIIAQFFSHSREGGDGRWGNGRGVEQ